jgi:hypothetical protein
MPTGDQDRALRSPQHAAEEFAVKEAG